MKIFKRIYYPVMAVLVVLMLVLGIVDSRVGGGSNLKKSQIDAAVNYATDFTGFGEHNSYDTSGKQDARTHIVDSLVSAGAKRITNTPSQDKDDDGNNQASYCKDGDNNVPTVYVQSVVVRQDSVQGDEVPVACEIENVILAIPGSNEDAILLYAGYDGAQIGGAADASTVGALLQTAVSELDKAKTTKPQNTIVFLFGDASQEGDLGAAAFIHQFVGFNNVTDKIGAVADFSLGGTDGTLMVYASSGDQLNMVGKYSGFNNGSYFSSALKLLTKRSDYSENGVFGDYSALTFTNRDGFNRYHTASDNKINRKLVEQQANAMSKFISCFGSGSLNKAGAKSAAVYFSYLDVMTVYYPNAVAFVIAGIIIGLVIAIVILNIKNKAFTWGKLLGGAAVQLITIAASSLVLLGLYYLFALLLSGFGLIPFQSISQVSFAGTGLLVSACVMAITVAVMFYIILKRTFAVKAADVVRGNVMIFALVAFIMSFAAPAISYPFTCAALFSLLALLSTVLFKNKFKAKFNTDMERLFLYVWAIVFSLPLFLPVIFVAQTVYPAVGIVLIMAVIIGLGGFIAPFADYLKPTLDKVFKKLPPYTVRYEHEVTEMQEDRAKKGKFTEVKVKKVEKVKTHFKYLNRIGLSFAAIVSAVMIMLFCSFSTVYSSAATFRPDYYDSIYDDAMLFVYEKNGSSTASTVEVHDPDAYNFIRYEIKDLKYDSDKKAYVKDYNGDVAQILGNDISDFTKNGNEVEFKISDASNSRVTVTLTGANKITSVIFNSGDINRETQEYTFEDQDTIVFRMPYGYTDFTMTLTGDCNSISFEQHVYNANNLTATGDWDSLANYYLANTEVYEAIRSGVVIKITK